MSGIYVWMSGISYRFASFLMLMLYVNVPEILIFSIFSPLCMCSGVCGGLSPQLCNITAILGHFQPNFCTYQPLYEGSTGSLIKICELSALSGRRGKQTKANIVSANSRVTHLGHSPLCYSLIILTRTDFYSIL